jgi:hypothetical protein
LRLHYFVLCPPWSSLGSSSLFHSLFHCIFLLYHLFFHCVGPRLSFTLLFVLLICLRLLSVLLIFFLPNTFICNYNKSPTNSLENN